MKKDIKLEIYNKHGIEYDSKANKVNAPGIGWISLPLVDGNSKIGKGVYHFSTLPGKKDYHINIAFKTEKRPGKKDPNKLVSVTVIDNDNPILVDIAGTCICSCEGCYAMVGNYRYDTTLAYLAIRTILARQYINWLENCINAQIAAENIKLVRIHASGDFYGSDYIAMWQRIAIANPGTVFWSYTKNPAAEKAFDNIANCNIVKSMIPTIGKNYGTCKYIMDTYAFLKSLNKSVYICRCGIDENQHCINCKGCSKHDYVLFIEHSTSYNAKKDPLYPAIKALIDSHDIEIANSK